MNATFPSLKSRNFTPLWISQSLAALNDNVFRQSVIGLLVFSALDEGAVYASLTTALFVLPFFITSASAGLLADRFPKAKVMRWLRGLEILVFGLAAYGLYAKIVPLLLVCILLAGVVAAFFGPLKFAVVPELLPSTQLISANGLMEAGIFVAILMGTMIGSLAAGLAYGPELVIFILLTGSAIAWIASFFIPDRPAAAPHLRLDWNLFRTTRSVLAETFQNKNLKLVLLGIAWFWFVGSCFITQFAGFVKLDLNGNPETGTLFLGLFSIGISLGSVVCHKLLRGEVSAKYVPLAALLMTLFMIDLYFSVSFYKESLPASPATLSLFLRQWAGWAIMIDLLLISVAAGLYVVPLTTLMQTMAQHTHRARVVSAGNILDAALMVAASLIGAVLLKTGFSPADIFLTIGILNAAVALYICRLLPADTLKGFFAALFRLFYKIEIKGLEHLQQAGPRAVIVSNHLSYLDGTLLASFLPGKPLFAVSSLIAQKWWAKPFLRLVEAYPMNPAQPMATKGLIRAIQQDKRCVIFPEGRLTETGSLMKIYEGPGLIALKADAPIVPVRIDGLQYTPFSRMHGKVKLRWFPTLTITILPPQRFDIPRPLHGRARRHAIALKLYDIMANMMFESQNLEQTLPNALLQARDLYGGNSIILEDIQRQPVHYNRLLLGSVALGKELSRHSQRGDNIGLMLPNTIAAVTAFWGLQLYGRIPAMLNFTSGTQNILSSCQAASIKTIITSRQFVEKTKLETLIEALAPHCAILYLEDLRKNISPVSKLMAFLKMRFNLWPKESGLLKPHDIAAILFTSGSEGVPKGVALSHRNIIANWQQIRSRIDFTQRDVLFNALPLFHSFGLTAGMIVPVLSGVRSFQYLSPLHYRIVAELLYDTSSTIFFGTDTFLNGYARIADPYDFHRLRYVFAGAEKLRDETRNLWEDKFGIRIFEGYGVTETAPVLAINTPMHYRAGSVGRFLPGIDYRLEQVPGIETGGRLFVRGPNVMAGYLKADRPGIINADDFSSSLKILNNLSSCHPDLRRDDNCIDNKKQGQFYRWHDTGDVVTVDDEGFVRIVARVKRFAKIAGEMISLNAVEEIVQRAFPDFNHAVISVPDARKGEALVLVTTRQDMTADNLITIFRQRGATELMIPRTILTRDELPLLGIGKVDYVNLKQWVLEI